MYFSDLHDHLSQAKLNYACSANLMESVDVVNLTPSQIEFLSQIPHVAMRETMRDFIGNLQFRRDYWVKGSHKLDRSGLRDALGAMRVVLHSPPDSIALTIKTPVGEATKPSTNRSSKRWPTTSRIAWERSVRCCPKRVLMHHSSFSAPSCSCP